MKIRVDNLATEVTEDDLRTLFELFGAVAAATIDPRRRWGQIDMPRQGRGPRGHRHAQRAKSQGP